MSWFSVSSLPHFNTVADRDGAHVKRWNVERYDATAFSRTWKGIPSVDPDIMIQNAYNTNCEGLLYTALQIY